MSIEYKALKTYHENYEVLAYDRCSHQTCESGY